MRKGIMAAALLLVMSAGAWAQESKKWEHNIYVASGVLFDKYEGRMEAGFTGKVGYGVAYQLAERWSLMPGVDFRIEDTDLFNAGDGADSDNFMYIDVPIAARYHVDKNWVVGLAPVLSFCVHRDEWYIDANPLDPRNGLTKIKMFNVGLQPSIAYQWRRIFLGVEANFGLLDVEDTHGLSPHTGRHFHNIMARLGVRF